MKKIKYSNPHWSENHKCIYIAFWFFEIKTIKLISPVFEIPDFAFSKIPTGSKRTYRVNENLLGQWETTGLSRKMCFSGIFKIKSIISFVISIEDIKTSLKFSIKRWLDLKSKIDTLFNSSIFKAEWNFYWIC